MHDLRRRTITAAVAATAALAAPASALAAPGQPVGTLDLGPAGSASILSFSWGLSNAGGSTGGGGLGSGKVNLQDFHFTKRIDPVSTNLVRAAALGTSLPQAVVSVPIGGPSSPFAIEYRFRDVAVTSVSQGGSAGETTEQVSLGYSAFEQTIGNSSKFGWAPSE